MAKYYVISSYSSLLEDAFSHPSPKLKHLIRTFGIAWCRGSLSTRRIKIKTSSAPILFCATGLLKPQQLLDQSAVSALPTFD